MPFDYAKFRAERARKRNKRLAEIMTADLMLEIERLKAENEALKARIAELEGSTPDEEVPAEETPVEETSTESTPDEEVPAEKTKSSRKRGGQKKGK